MTRYGFHQLMRILTDKRCFVMKEGKRYFFATIVAGRGSSGGIIDPYAE